MTDFQSAVEKAKAIAARLGGGKHRLDEDEGEESPSKRPAYGDTVPSREPLPDQQSAMYGAGGAFEAATSLVPPPSSSQQDEEQDQQQHSHHHQQQQEQQQPPPPQQQQQQQQQLQTPPPALGGGLLAPPHAHPGLGFSTTSEVTIYIPNDCVGGVIGRGGEKIQELQSSTGAHVQVERDQDQAPGATQRKVAVSGAPDRVQLAVDAINRIVREIQDKRNNQFNPDTARSLDNAKVTNSYEKVVAISVPNSVVGLVIGRSGATIKELQERSGCRIQVSQVSEMAPGSQDRTVTLTGSDSAIANAQQLIHEKLRASQEGNNNNNNINISSGSGSSSSSSSSSNREAAPLVMKVPEAMVGLLIGKSGQTIKELQSRSGARIQIAQPHEMPPGSVERNITITGSREAVMSAQSLVHEKLNEARTRDTQFGNRPRTSAPPPPPPTPYGATPAPYYPGVPATAYPQAYNPYAPPAVPAQPVAYAYPGYPPAAPQVPAPYYGVPPAVPTYPYYDPHAQVTQGAGAAAAPLPPSTASYYDMYGGSQGGPPPPPPSSAPPQGGHSGQVPQPPPPTSYYDGSGYGGGMPQGGVGGGGAQRPPSPASYYGGGHHGGGGAGGGPAGYSNYYGGPPQPP